MPNHGSTAPAAQGLSRVSPPPHLPFSARARPGKPLLMSSAKMMLVRRGGLGQGGPAPPPSGSTAARPGPEARCWPPPAGLTTCSGKIRVCSLELLEGQGDRSQSSAASVCPQTHRERGAGLCQLQTWVSWAAKPLCWEQAPPAPSSSHRSRDMETPLRSTVLTG